MTGVLRWARLGVAIQRWEVLASVAGLAIGVIAATWLATSLRMLAAEEPACPDPAAFVAGCEAYARRFGETAEWARQLINLAWLAPFGFGLVLGVPIVAREVEHGTVGLAWTLSRSRLRWLARRAGFALALLLLVLGAVAIASEALAAAMLPNLDLANDFTWFGRRGWLLVARGVAAFGVGLAVGALVGRVLPGLLVAALASVLVFGGLSLAMDRWNEVEAVVQAYGIDRGGALFVGQRTQLPTGELVEWADLEQRGLEVAAIDPDGGLYADVADVGRPDRLIGYERELLIPGERYAGVVLREAGVTLAVAVVLMGAAAAAVVRRRPA